MAGVVRPRFPNRDEGGRSVRCTSTRKERKARTVCVCCALHEVYFCDLEFDALCDKGLGMSDQHLFREPGVLLLALQMLAVSGEG